MMGRTRLLLVEDDRDIRETLACVLEEEGYAVDAAANGREALALLRVRPAPKVVLLDLMMPTMDGWQLHAEMQRVPALASIPVIVLSADSRRDAIDGIPGATLLRKPIDIVELLDVVQRASSSSTSATDGIPSGSRDPVGAAP